MENLGLTCGIASSRDSLAESAKNSQCVGVRPAIGAPYDGQIGDILPVKHSQVGAIVLKLVADHAFSAISSSLLPVGRGDADVKRGHRVSKSVGENIGWPQVSAWDETWHL